MDEERQSGGCLKSKFSNIEIQLKLVFYIVFLIDFKLLFGQPPAFYFSGSNLYNSKHFAMK